MAKYKKAVAAFLSIIFAAGINTSICYAGSNGYKAETYVTMTYNENGKTPVIIRYVDENGNIIADSCAIFGWDGDAYEVSAVQIQGYELKEVKGNEKGIIGKDDTVTFIYKKKQSNTIKNEENMKNVNNNQNNLNSGQNGNTGNKILSKNDNNTNTGKINNKNNNVLIKDASNTNNTVKNNSNASSKVRTGDSYLFIWMTAIGAIFCGITGIILYRKYKIF